MAGAKQIAPVRTIAERYPASPMKEGMLFHSLFAPHSGVEREQIPCTGRVELNDPAFRQAWGWETEFPRVKSVRELFETQVERIPNAVALVYTKGEVSYRELDNQADRAALHLRSLGVSPEVPIRIDAKKAGLPAELAKAMERWNTPAISWTHAPPDAHFARTISCKPSLLQYGCGNGKAQPRL